MSWNVPDSREKKWELGPGQTIPCVQKYTYLGIEINSKISYNSQIMQMMNDANIKGGALKKWAFGQGKLSPWVLAKNIYGKL